MKAFSLLELIFVIVIMGILTFTALQFIPNETLLSDTQVLKEKILEKKSNALGYEKEGYDSYVCIRFNTEWLNNDDNTSSEKIHYKFKSEISAEGLKNGDTVCFDYMGRPYDGNVTKNLTNILHKTIIIDIFDKSSRKTAHLILYPISGSVKAVE